MDLPEKHLRDALQEKNLSYILDFLTKHCNRSVEQILDSSRRNILYTQLDYINNHDDNDGNVHFEIFDMQDFVSVVDQTNKEFNHTHDESNPQQTTAPKAPQLQHSLKYEAYKDRLDTKKNDLKEMMEIRAKWMKIVIDERKNILFQQMENMYSEKLNQLYQFDKQMIQITCDVETQYEKFTEFSQKTKEQMIEEDKSENESKIDFEQRNNTLLQIQNKLLNNKLKLENIETMIDTDVITFNANAVWDKQKFETGLNEFMSVDSVSVEIKTEKKYNYNENMLCAPVQTVKKAVKSRSKTCGNIGKNLTLFSNKKEMDCNDITWSYKYKGNDIIINEQTNECILSGNAINQSIVINKRIPKGQMMKCVVKLNKNGGSGCYFIGVISDVDKCDFNGIAMYGSSLINAYGIDDTNKWIYKGENGIDIVEWKPEIKSNDILTIVTELKENNELNLWFTLNNKIAIKPKEASHDYSMNIAPQKLSSDEWYVAVSLVETGSSCALKSCSILK